LIARYFAEPYRFVPPYRGTLWCRVARWLVPSHLRKQVPRWEFQGLDYLRESLEQRAGILLTPNHCRIADPLVLAMMGLSLGRFFYYVVSHHVFKGRRLMAWWLNRIGGFGILREGADRESLRASARILAGAERPLVLFPEGTWFRQNDRLGPLQEGVALIARQALRQGDRPIRIHPVAIKYWALGDPRPELRRRLDGLEARLGWRPQRHLGLLDRFDKLGNAFLAVKEIEYLGEAGEGPLDPRIRRLGSALVGELERQHLGKQTSGGVLERVRRVRFRLVRQLAEAAGDRERIAAINEDLDRLLFCENLNSHSQEYLHGRPSHERMIETVQRLEETIADGDEVPVVPHGAAVAVGPALDAREWVHEKGAGKLQPDPLVRHLAAEIQGLLDGLLAQGPPPSWDCRPRAAAPPAGSPNLPAPQGLTIP
jgi:1-acyl-sn-glycerol-3-phosphate acyltransferase